MNLEASIPGAQMQSWTGLCGGYISGLEVAPALKPVCPLEWPRLPAGGGESDVETGRTTCVPEGLSLARGCVRPQGTFT